MAQEARVVGVEEECGFRWLRLKKLAYVDQTGRRRFWEMAERTTHSMHAQAMEPRHVHGRHSRTYARGGVASSAQVAGGRWHARHVYSYHSYQGGHAPHLPLKGKRGT